MGPTNPPRRRRSAHDPVVTASPVSVVGELFKALDQRDFGRARRCWRDDAVWHVTGSHDLAGDHRVDDYLALLQQWFADYPDYSVEVTDFRASGEQGVAVHIRSQGGRAPGVASGWMIYRIAADAIAEGWGIPTFADGRYPF